MTEARWWRRERYLSPTAILALAYATMAAALTFPIVFPVPTCGDVSPVGTSCIRELGHGARHRGEGTRGGFESWTSPTDWLPPGAGGK